MALSPERADHTRRRVFIHSNDATIYVTRLSMSSGQVDQHVKIAIDISSYIWLYYDFNVIQLVLLGVFFARAFLDIKNEKKDLQVRPPFLLSCSHESA